MTDERLDELIEKHLAGELSAVEREEFDHMLNTSETARDLLAARALDLIDLGRALGRPLPELPRPRARFALLPTLAAAAAVLAAALFLIETLRPGADGGRQGDGREIAAGRPDDEPGPRDADGTSGRFLETRTEELAEGRIAATGGTRYELGDRDGRGRRLIRLDRGRLAIEVPEDAGGFLLETPEGTIEDIGTRFEVDATSAATELLVREGRVRFSPAAGSEAFEVGPAAGQVGLVRDGRIAEILELQGLVWVRPGASTRRTPLAAGDILRPGDLVGTGLRGAHAVALRFVNGAIVHLGPGSQVEIVDGESLRFANGEIAVEIPAERGLVLRHGREAERRLGVGTSYFAADDSKLRSIEKAPFWYEAFRDDRLAESLGKLVARVDGRDVPLTIGYHKVSVDIRDQIARTVIDETFVNHTSGTLEGVFYFPLPAGASVSSFAMWVGDRRVEGEIVEKERAREIYETMLREKRDPGLLEWTGGSVFKARVFPIDHRKRIQISYTQVLPRKAGVVRYRYPLRSEMLRRTPLERLEIELKVWSQAPLVAARSTSHTGREVLTEQAASFEYSADACSPDRDFAFEYRTAEEPGRLRLIPHRRGDEGYFLATIEPPERAAGDRDLLPEGLPQDLLVLIDNSGSVDAELRRLQAAFLESLLSSLRPEDRFNLALFDVERRWLFDSGVAPDERNVADALALLDQLQPLGWTDQAAALEDARGRAGRESRIVLVGDGMDSLAAADLGALGRELTASWEDGPPVHVVALGSKTEDILLEDFARLGRGSLHHLGAPDAAPAAARELLDAILRPGFSDIEIRIAGVPTAAVHAVSAAALPADGQAVLVGRFDTDLTGTGEHRIQVQARRGEETFHAECLAGLAETEDDNSFIPRLWARRHIDHLLRLGRSDTLVARIVELSAAFQVATPYTSFLVIESEADRERFGLTRTMRMRDGEDFFTEGRAAADFDLIRAQMERARSWRRDLGARVLAKYREAGADLMGTIVGFNGWGPDQSIVHDTMTRDIHLGMPFTTTGEAAPPIGNSRRALERASERYEETFDGDSRARREYRYEQPRSRLSVNLEPANMPVAGGFADGYFGLREIPGDFGRVITSGGYRLDRAYPIGGHSETTTRLVGGPFGSFFPYLGTAGPTATRNEDEPDPDWPGEALRLAREVEALPALLSGDSGFAIRWRLNATGEDEGEAAHPLEAVLGSAGIWQQAVRRDGESRHCQWLIADRRGVYSDLWNCGRERDAGRNDERAFPWPAQGVFSGIVQAHRHDRLVTSETEKDQLTLDFPPESEGTYGTRYVIARAPARLLRVEIYSAWGLFHRLEYSDHVAVAGRELPRRIVRFDAEGRETEVHEIAIEEIGGEALRRELARRRAELDGALFIESRHLVSHEARLRLLAGEATVEDRLLLLDELVGRGRRLEAAPLLAELMPTVAGRPIERAFRLSWAALRGENEELAEGLREFAAVLAAGTDPAELERARFVMQLCRSLAAVEEIEILDVLEVVHRRSTRRSALARWRGAVLGALGRSRMPDEHERRLRAFIAESPHLLDLRTKLVDLLVARREPERAIALLDELLGDDALVGDAAPMLRRRILDLLWDSNRHDLFLDRALLWQDDARTFDQLRLGRILLALLHEGRLDRYDATVTEWLGYGLLAERDDARKTRLWVAFNALSGRMSGHPMNRHVQRHLPALVATTRVLGLDQREFDLARGLAESSLRDRPEVRALAVDLGRLALREADALPLDDLAALVPFVATDARRGLIEKILDRFIASASIEFEGVVDSLLANHGEDELRLRLLEHLRGLAGTTARRNEIDTRIYWVLRNRPLTDESEARLLELCSRFSTEGEGSAERAERNLTTRLRALEDLLPFLVARRESSLVGAREDLNDLGPRAAQAARDEARSEARRGRAAALAVLRARVDTDLAPWIDLHRIDQLRRAGGEVAELLPPAVRGADEALRRKTMTKTGLVLAERWFCLVATLALAADEAETVTTLLAGMDASSGLEVERIRLEWLCARGADETFDLALRGHWESDEVERRLLWGPAHARNLAATGELAEAVAVLRAMHRIRPLEAAEYQELMTWLQLLDDRAGMEAARRSRHLAMSDWELNSWLSSRLGLYRARGDEPPQTMGPEIPEALEDLFSRAANPGQHLWVLRNYWQTTRDHRLLAALAAALPRQSSQGIHDFLRSIRLLVEDIHEEAALDHMDRALAAGIASADHPRKARALRLLRLHVCERALAQMQGAEAWRERTLEALRASWPEGFGRLERARHADSLHLLGTIEDAEIRRVALEQMARLHKAATPGTEERFQIANARAGLLWENAARSESAGLRRAALDEMATPRGGRLPDWTRPAQAEYARQLIALGEAAVAEGFWRDQLALDYEPDRSHWLRLKLLDALEALARIERGTYARVREECLALLGDEVDPFRTAALLGALRDVWRETARDDDELVDADLEALAAGFAKLLDRHHHENAGGLVQVMAHALREHRGDRRALRFLLDRLQNDPEHREALHLPLWEHTAHLLAEILRGNLAAADPAMRQELERYLLAELAADLESGVSYDRALYSQRGVHFWSGSLGRFAREAREVLERRPEDDRLARSIASYLRHDLHETGAAADFLAAFDRRRPLDLEGLTELLDHQRAAKQLEAALGAAERLVAMRTDLIGFQIARAEILFDLDRRDEAMARALEVEKRFLPERDRQAGLLQTVASLAWRVQSDEQSVRLHKDLIRLLARDGGNRSTDWETRAHLSESFIRLGRVDEAVEEACSAVVLWPARSSERARCLAQLRELISKLPDLDGWLARFEAELEESGQENPILRAAAAQVLVTAGRHEDAIRQLRPALEVSPEREDWRELLIGSLDQCGRAAEGDRELLELARSRPHEFALWQRLGERLKERGDAANSRRAITNLVEHSPLESEGLALFAGLAEQDGRIEEALRFWARVGGVRPEDPAGLLGELRCQVRLGRRSEAFDVVRRVRAASFAERFGNLELKMATILRGLDD